MWHEEKIADDGFCGFNAAAYLLRHHLPLMYDSDDMLDSKATLSQVRIWLSQALKQDLNLDQMPRSEDGIRDRSPSRGLGDVYKRQYKDCPHSACCQRCLTAMEKKFVTLSLIHI